MLRALLAVAAFFVALSTAANACALRGSNPGMLTGVFPSSWPAVRFEVKGTANNLLARQIVFNTGKPVNEPFLAQAVDVYHFRTVLTTSCYEDTQTTLTAETVIDNGPQVKIKDLYLAQNAVAVRFYAFWDEFLRLTPGLGSGK
jgi:hypothetical protein